MALNDNGGGLPPQTLPWQREASGLTNVTLPNVEKEIEVPFQGKILHVITPPLVMSIDDLKYGR